MALPSGRPQNHLENKSLVLLRMAILFGVLGKTLMESYMKTVMLMSAMDFGTTDIMVML